jgi:hypothetical protein
MSKALAKEEDELPQIIPAGIRREPVAEFFGQFP